jgi:DNA-binding FadR family transcriptional regulator
MELPARAAGKRCAAVTAELGRRIVAGTYGPGDSLPTEANLCTMFGVSRTTVREATKRLHGKGMVAVGPRSGTRVLPTLHWNQFDAEVLGWRLECGADASTLDQLYDIRECFEPRACELAAKRGDPPARLAIAREFARIADETLDTGRRIDADLAFHLAIFAATGNLFFVSLGAAIRTALHLSFSLSQRRSPIPADELLLHEQVCHAILAGNGTAAARAMRRLLAASRATLGLALHKDAVQ